MRTVVFLILLFAQFMPLAAQDTLVVAPDGSGDFITVTEAVESCRAFMETEKVILIREGIYREKVDIPSWLTHITLIGEGQDKTIISWDDYASLNNMGTFRTWTMKVSGDYITLKDLCVENSAGPVGQAVALHVEGDRFCAMNCSIRGNQDTLFASGLHSRQHYTGCTIEGTTDFIFGPATALFDDCTIICKKDSYITAASTPADSPYGFVFRKCRIMATTGVTKVYLGRPWRDYARVLFLYCELAEQIRPEGWHNWSQPERENTAFFAEYGNSGPGAGRENRVNWSHELSDTEAAACTTENILGMNYCKQAKAAHPAEK
ncbi:MAG: pectinesterase family protein [Bacteroidota bacterium]